MRNNIYFIVLIFFIIIFIISLTLTIIMPSRYEFLGVIKPATLFQYSGFLSFALSLNFFKRYFLKLSQKTINLLIIIGFFLIMATLFEALWAFFYWFSNYELDVINGAEKNTLTLDIASYTTPKDFKPLIFYNKFSLNFSAKKNILLFMASVYFTYFLIKLDKERYLIYKNE